MQARRRQDRGRGGAALHDPNAWTVGILVVTGLALLGRHPIARALGTEVDTPRSETSATTPATRPAPAAPAMSLPVASVPTHAPVDPFRALVTSSGKVLAQVAAAAAAPTPGAPEAPGTSSCAGSVHRVVAGDTLWTLAARATRSADTGRVTVAWHRLYDVNRAVVGSDPSLLRVGSMLCLPASLPTR